VIVVLSESRKTAKTEVDLIYINTVIDIFGITNNREKELGIR